MAGRIELKKVGVESAEEIRTLQIAAFTPLLEKYHDYDMSLPVRVQSR